jgi:GNAT superfamily N-acetyltransferase
MGRRFGTKQERRAGQSATAARVRQPSQSDRADRSRSLKGVTIALEAKPWAAAKKAIGDGLDDFNVAAVKALGITAKQSEFIAGARDSRGALIGGFFCQVYLDTCFLKWAWVGEAARRKDVGRRLMAQCEDEARKRGASVLYLDTFSFQARPFYEKLGYKVFGTLKLGAKGIKRVWMVKVL